MTSNSVTQDHAVEELLVPILDRLAEGNLEIPILPHVASQILMISNDPNGNASQLSELIQQDQVLASQVLQLANSPAYGARYPIESLHQATAWLGLNFLAGTAFSLSVQKGVFNVRGYESEVKELWHHTFTVALYAKAIAGRIGQNSDTAFMCGLLHAIGKPFVIHTVNQFRDNSETPLPWSTMAMVIKESYVEVGRQLGESWALPAPVREAIVCHEDCAYHLATSPTKGAVVTCMAIHLALHLMESPNDDPQPLCNLPVVHHLNLSQEDMTALLDMGDSIKASMKALVL